MLPSSLVQMFDFWSLSRPTLLTVSNLTCSNTSLTHSSLYHSPLSNTSETFPQLSIALRINFNPPSMAEKASQSQPKWPPFHTSKLCMFFPLPGRLFFPGLHATDSDYLGIHSNVIREAISDPPASSCPPPKFVTQYYSIKIYQIFLSQSVISIFVYCTPFLMNYKHH